MARPVVEQYRGIIRQSLELVGVSGSIEPKVLAAVGIQFGVSVALAAVAVVFSGLVQFTLTGLLLAGATVVSGEVRSPSAPTTCTTCCSSPT